MEKWQMSQERNELVDFGGNPGYIMLRLVCG